ncbi:energy-coupling factor ABC transporter ATP-binding protein [Paenibacillus silvae]|uniref:energy-coupling factor ABC transporter ATP-binding protein n=1 Tax=Paenibacillus silvae TaxID=1325358 RepID=UPI002004970B|nr:ATP-binding cassette domain-containing protein [Paenibacillus silvae]MCK6073633.1 ATP-binding cassette domain-containing protein [Paenibacillus silvae]MCK6148891.1 ATP-binding cassette domain-containing protein [Paenibacillus silvae]MCK6267190.1 ATP-binding cassette domain-containing protein [Paenibacillus silvae]
MQDKLPIISLKDVRVHYTVEGIEVKKALDGVSLALQAGEWLSIVGANGSGKSTLAGILLGFMPLSSGERNVPENLIIRGVLQQPDAQVLGDTIEEEFHFALSHLHISSLEKENRRREAMQIVGLYHPPTAAIAQLSGGQKQLLNIATALAARPDVLIMDEPAAMLDPDARDRLEHIVQTVTSNGTAVLWITHHLEEATLSDRIMAMNKGRCVYDGTPMSFFYPLSEETGAGVSQESGTRGDALQQKWVQSPCEQLGLEPPFTVKTCLILKRQGKLQHAAPLRPEQLTREVARW